MENDQAQEWAEAQKITFTEDLIAAARQQLKFLSNVDKKPQLYGGHTLNKAIYRYKYCWLPLLARIEGTQALQGLVVVPLDCEWIWHCHRLNPVRYKVDCLKLYGKILGTKNILSSSNGVNTEQTQVIWNKMYPNEPYELDTSNHEDQNGKYVLPAKKSTVYDLVAAVKRQTTFFYQVSRPCMKDELFLEGAVARYKGFLHLIKHNAKMGIKRFCVPTYDIDLIWHSHQLNPTSYCKDSVALLGWVLPHNDTDSNRSKGEKLDVGFSGTTKQWEETFGLRYWRAGSMYRGTAPTPLDIGLRLSDDITVTKRAPLVEPYKDFFHFPTTMLMEVMVELVGVKDLSFERKRKVLISLSKKQPDKVFKSKRRMTIYPEAKEKQVATFECEPTGDFLIELISYSPSTLPNQNSEKVLGTSSISLKKLFTRASTLSSIEKWFELAPDLSAGLAFSFTAPIKAGYMLHVLGTRNHLHYSPGDQHTKNWVSIVDEAGNKILGIQMRDSNKHVVCRTPCGKERVLAEAVEDGWLIMGSQWFLHPHKATNEKDGRMFELNGCGRKVVFIAGRRLEYESKTCRRRDSNERNFMTVVEFTTEDPHGKGIALVNARCGGIQIKEEWFVLCDIMMKNELNGLLKEEDCKCKCILVGGCIEEEEEETCSWDIGFCGGCVDASGGGCSGGSSCSSSCSGGGGCRGGCSNGKTMLLSV